MKTINAYYLDASALIKLYISEKRSEIVNKLVAKQSQIYTTTLCVAEALRVFKRVHLVKQKPPNTKAYANCCLDLISTINDENIIIDDQSFLDRETYEETEKLILKYEIDLSDMLQILSIKSSLPQRSEIKTFLITDDEGLFCAAKCENINTIWLRDQDVYKKLELEP
ncbi:MAG: type II toxin-antitoxin system VapC family toxin [Proteobacteria bacterium]|nr:type II toxin-antitoxin system VapC family toxin [Pseudomonadota bacterium]MBU1709026.1 type II toxin-antitoxin system VapC family toxin [Pseudomonadota bacterium]